MDLREIEKKWQKRWDAKKLFEADVDHKRKKFFFTVPYPYASGPAHVGHGRTYTLGDITARFMRMKGYNLLWPMAWHITGTPVLAIAKRIADGEKSVIEDHKDYIRLHKPNEVEKIIKTFVDPENVANFYAGVWINDIKELGCSIDWRRQFTTGEKIYNQFIKWQYHHLNSSGHLVKGTHPVFYCPSDGNPVTTDDVKGGDGIEMSIGEFYLIKMKFQDGFFVVATLRPETLYGTTNVWVNPKSTCVKAQVDKEIWYISKAASQKLNDQGHKVKIISEFLGSKILDKEIEVPLVNKKVPILPASFVDENVGTGVVFSVPGHAPLDLIALKELGKDSTAKPIGVIKVDGFSEIPAEDMLKKFNIKSQNEKTKLEKATHELYSQEFYNGVMKENSGDLSGLRVSEAKEKIYQMLSSKTLAGKMYDAQVKDLDGETVNEVFCRDGTKVVVKVIEQWFLNYADEKWKASAQNLLSKISIVPDIYRKSFESSINWLHEWPCARNRGLGTKLPYDEKWIIESLSDSTIYMAFYTIANHLRKNKIKPEQLTVELFDFVFLGIGDVKQISKKTKISDSLIKKMREEFSYWYPLDERRTAIMHIPNHLSFFVFHHATIFPENLWPKKVSLNEALLAEGRKMSKSLGNVMPLVEVIRKHGADVSRLFLASAAEPASTLDWKEKDIESLKSRLKRFYEISSKSKSKSGSSTLDKWIVSKFYQNLSDATKFIENYQFKQYSQKIFFETLNDVEDYISRTKNLPPKEIVSDWVLSLSPLIPFACEELWNKLGNKTFVSAESWPKIDDKKIDREVLGLEEIFKRTLSDLNHVLKLAGDKKNLYLYFVTDKEISYFKELSGYLKKLFDFKKVELHKVSDKKKHDPQNKSAKAKYGRPAIYLE